MKITIITATFNSEKYINNCLVSVAKQDYFDIEHIVIDGLSSDNTLNQLNNYNHIAKTISAPDKGIYDAINKGIKIATGDIVGILNSDDFFADDAVVSRIAASFKKYDQLEAVYADVNFVDRENIDKTVRHYSSKYFKPSMFRFGFQPAHPTFYAKREVFEELGLYRTDLKIAGDFELMLRFILKNKIKYKYVNDVWVKMRTGGVSTSGVSSVVKLNNEIIKAHKINGLYTNKLFVYSKYLFKWWGFVKKL